jgi:NitT/TauT family transport system permease protein
MYFQLRGTLPKRTETAIAVAGTVIVLALWTAITEGGLIPKSILPSPVRVLTSFGELHNNDALVRNAAFSLYLNTLGLLEAIALALPIGFVIGLFPIFRTMTGGYITAGRFIPLTAVVGVFIAWFGIEINMKVQFLAFSIFLFLLPVVIQKIDEVEEVYVQTVTTLGASRWQTIKMVFIPAVLSRIFDSIRVLAALSWTYIVVAEMVNANGGGVGALTYISARQSRIDKVFAILLTIVLIGFLQDRILLFADRMLFPYKYLKK